MSEGFARRLEGVLPHAVEHFGTPFHLYDVAGIDETCRAFTTALADLPCREYFAVKALPNPVVLRALRAHGFGFDCSSLPELALARAAGAQPHDLFFTASNATGAELRAAVDAGARVTVDDETTLDRLLETGPLPERLTFRVNPGPGAPEFDRTLFGDPEAAKFGIRSDRLAAVCARAAALGVRSAGLHMMITANALDVGPTLFTLDHLVARAAYLRDELGLDVDVLNVGGGFGIPYRPGEQPLDLGALANALRERLASWPPGWRPTVCFENGRYVTGPHGVLVTKVVNRMSKWRQVVGVDASVNALLRTVVYRGVHHHVSAPLVEQTPTETVDVVGSLCTNVDKLAEQRELPRVHEGDLLLVHDTGAHGHAMGFTYNGRLRPPELLLQPDGDVELVRRRETEADYLATLTFTPDVLPGPALVGR